MPHDIKGQGIYAYVTLKTGAAKSDDLKKELAAHVRTVIGPIATPDKIQWADALPKTRSGKIMRRILKKSPPTIWATWATPVTLADPTVVDDIVKNRVYLKSPVFLITEKPGFFTKLENIKMRVSPKQETRRTRRLEL